jgi:hypothetical protein
MTEKSSKIEKISCESPRPLAKTKKRFFIAPSHLPVRLIELHMSLTTNSIIFIRHCFLVAVHLRSVSENNEAGTIGQPHQLHG